MPAMYSQYLMGDSPRNQLFPSDILSVIVEQLFAAHLAEPRLSLVSACVHSAQDLARLAQSSKVLHTTALASWQYLCRIIKSQMRTLASCSVLDRYPGALKDLPLPTLAGLDWVSH